MKYNIKFKKDAMKFLENHRDVKDKFINIFKELALDYENGLKKYDIAKISGYDLFRLRVGKYRAIYTLVNDELFILVLNIDSRGDIYKNL